MSRQLALDLPVAPALGRADFVVAPSNADALAWIDRWPDWPGRRLAIAGPAGSGKSHLAAIWRRAAAAVPVRPIADADPADLVPAAGCAVLEDGAAIAGDATAEAALFHLLNHLDLGGGSLLFTDRRVPGQWPVVLPDLRSRLATVTNVRLGAPEDHLLAALLTKQFADRQLRVGREVIDYLVARMERSGAAAARLVAAIDAAALATHRNVTIPLVREVLAGDF